MSHVFLSRGLLKQSNTTQLRQASSPRTVQPLSASHSPRPLALGTEHGTASGKERLADTIAPHATRKSVRNPCVLVCLCPLYTDGLGPSTSWRIVERIFGTLAAAPERERGRNYRQLITAGQRAKHQPTCLTCLHTTGAKILRSPPPIAHSAQLDRPASTTSQRRTMIALARRRSCSYALSGGPSSVRAIVVQSWAQSNGWSTANATRRRKRGVESGVPYPRGTSISSSCGTGSNTIVSSPRSANTSRNIAHARASLGPSSPPSPPRIPLASTGCATSPSR